jgi:hypothetical protein
VRKEISQFAVIMDQGHAELLNVQDRLLQHLEVINRLLAADDLTGEEVAELRRLMFPPNPQILAVVTLHQQVAMASMMLGQKIFVEEGQ